MKKITYIALALVITLLCSCITTNENTNSITFPSKDGLDITADLYLTEDDKAPMIILFHQAGWSRGEYMEIAPKLNKLGFNCIAIDQRSGKEVLDVDNETFKRAKEKGLPTTFVDAEQDMHAAIEYVKKTYKTASKYIIWGSSYSSALVLKIGGERGDVNGILSFAPGEYFTNLDKPEDYVKQYAMKINCPTFITSMQSEKPQWWDIYEAIPSDHKAYFLPETDGQHGSRALWERFPEHENYWKATTDFLSQFKK